MIKVNYNNNLSNITITGHSGYASYGNDIVCASVSSIVSTSVNLAHEFDNSIEYKDNGEVLEIINNTKNENVYKTLNNMMNLLLDLEKQYPKNIKISKGE